MEISARVLREVEFNSSLRGYNTDEVDEFLEQVADGVDRLQAEAKAAIERADNAERTAHDRTGGFDDDDSIRRTLVLAQRTADLAIR
jgi:cell division initiation protein